MNENTNPPAEPAYSAPVPEEQVVEPTEPTEPTADETAEGDAPEEHDHQEDHYDEAGVSDDLEGDFDADETDEENSE